MAEKKLGDTKAFVFNKDGAGRLIVSVSVYEIRKGLKKFFQTRGKCPHCPVILKSKLDKVENNTIKDFADVASLHIMKKHTA